jgi:hypothetical protein
VPLIIRHTFLTVVARNRLGIVSEVEPSLYSSYFLLSADVAGAPASGEGVYVRLMNICSGLLMLGDPFWSSLITILLKSRSTREPPCFGFLYKAVFPPSLN